MDSYKYLFPFEKIESGSRILIYGAGVMGQEYLRQVLITSYCEVVGMIDKNYMQYGGMRVPVYSPEKVFELNFDYVVIALQKSDWLNEILLVLEKAGVPKNKIVYTFLRDSESVSLFGEEDGCKRVQLAYEKSPISVAFSVTGGIGDMVMQKSFITAIVALIGACSVDIYNVETQEMLSFLYQDDAFINCIMPNLGVRYESNCKKYSLAFFIEGGAYIRVDNMDYEVLKKVPQTLECIKRIVEYCEHEGASMNTPVHSLLSRRKFTKKDCYSWFDCGGALAIDRNVHIPLSSQGREWYEKSVLNGKKFITVNYGNGKCSDGKLVSKSWPLEYFEELVEMIHFGFPDIAVVQVGASGVEEITGADIGLVGESFESLAYILKNSRLHIDIDGGLVHIASQLGTKCVVLFGPTPMWFYGYEENVNIAAGTCEGCFGLYKNMYECAKGMEKPGCMFGIKPGMVMENIDNLLRQ